MSQIDSHLKLIGYSSTFIHSIFGFKIISTQIDKYSYVAKLSHSLDMTELTVTALDIEGKGEKFIVTTLSKCGSQVRSVSINYSDFFKDIKLPVSTDKLDEYLIDNNNFNETLVNVPFNVFQQTQSSCTENKSLFEEIIIPSFKTKGYVNELSNAHKDIIKNWFGYTPTLGRIKPTSERKQLPEAMTKFDDEYEILQNQPREDPLRIIPSIGDSDRDPFAGRNPDMKPYLDTSFEKPSGMIPDKNHPIFQNPGNLGGNGIGEVHGGLNMGPPGSRYDFPFGNDINDEGVGMGLPRGSFRGGFSNNSNNGPFSGNPRAFGSDFGTGRYPGSGFM